MAVHISLNRVQNFSIVMEIVDILPPSVKNKILKSSLHTQSKKNIFRYSEGSSSLCAGWDSDSCSPFYPNQNTFYIGVKADGGSVSNARYGNTSYGVLSLGIQN